MRSYLVYFSATVIAVLVLTVALGLAFEPFLPLVGDLTRVGNHAEKDFGWTAPQPPIRVLANGPAMTDPDILVLGDSFSRSNFWQSVATAESRQRIQSFEIARVGCIDNWLAHALKHPTAKTIVIESVERSFLSNFRDLPACATTQPKPFEIGAWTTAAHQSAWPPEWHIARTFKVSLNTLAMQWRPTAILRDDQVVNAPIERSCARFSNRRADRLLYFSQDEEKYRWKQEELARAIANVLRMQKSAEQHGKKFVLMLVPDKLSAYYPCLPDAQKSALGKGQDLTAALIAAGIHTPDLLGAFRSNINRIEDLYRPNDTHVSEAGYILMAGQMTQFLARRSTP